MTNSDAIADLIDERWYCAKCRQVYLTPSQWTGNCSVCHRRMRRLAREEPAPRAVVAISEDRETLVALTPASVGVRFVAFCWDPTYEAYVPLLGYKDTGQDACEVLTIFLEGRS